MESLFYLFGVSNNTTDPTQEISNNNLVALFEKVSPKDFGPAYLSSNLKNMEWVNQKVIHHQNILQTVSERQTVIPFKFGSLFTSEEQVKVMLSEKEGAFERILSQLEGKKEWGFKLFYQEAELKDHLNMLPALASQLKNMSEASPGKHFILKKKYEEQLKEEKKLTINQIRHRVFAQLNEKMQVNLLKNTQAMAEKKGKVNVLNLAVLSNEADFREKVVALSAELEEEIFFFETTGPWPPYNFVEV